VERSADRFRENARATHFCLGSRPPPPTRQFGPVGGSRPKAMGRAGRRRCRPRDATGVAPPGRPSVWRPRNLPGLVGRIIAGPGEDASARGPRRCGGTPRRGSSWRGSSWRLVTRDAVGGTAPGTRRCGMRQRVALAGVCGAGRLSGGRPSAGRGSGHGAVRMRSTGGRGGRGRAVRAVARCWPCARRRRCRRYSGASGAGRGRCGGAPVARAGGGVARWLCARGVRGGCRRGYRQRTRRA
jgi:hypothetical protein